MVYLSKVILFSTGCPKCIVLKKKLSERNIEFIENNDVEEMTRIGFVSVPILEVDGKIMNFKEAVEWIGVQ